MTKLDVKKTIMVSEDMDIAMKLIVDEKKSEGINNYTVSDFIREAIQEKIKKEFS